MATKKTATKAPAKAAKAPASTSKATKAPAKAAKAAVVKEAARPRLGLVGKPKPKASDARLPGEQHPGQTGMTSRMHEQLGSQVERERHMYGGSTTPKRGAGRTNKKAVARARRRK